MSTKQKLLFLSRHDPNDGQEKLAEEMGYQGIKKVTITFSPDPVKDVKDAGITQKTIAIVAPTYICNKLLNAGYTLIKFINSPVKREKMVFCCVGAYKMHLGTKSDYSSSENMPPEAFDMEGQVIPHITGKIFQTFIKCPLSIDEQYESSLV